MTPAAGGSVRFVDLRWASAAAEAVWEERLRRIRWAWNELNWLSVAAGLRHCCIVGAGATDYAAIAGRWSAQGLHALPLYVRNDDLDYVNSAKRPLAGSPLAFVVAVGRQPDLAAFKQVWDTRDDEGIGRLLGYPACCRAFFQQVWVAQRRLDTTWPMAAGPRQHDPSLHTIDVTGAPQANVLWRWLGPRAVPHLPCSVACRPSAALGNQFVQLGRDMGYAQEMDWLLELLTWPVEWSASDGVAEIRTPIVRTYVQTDVLPGRRTVRWQPSSAAMTASR